MPPIVNASTKAANKDRHVVARRSVLTNGATTIGANDGGNQPASPRAMEFG